MVEYLKAGDELDISKFGLGTFIVKFEMPMNFIDDINNLYENAKDLPEHNQNLAGKIKDELRVTEILTDDMKNGFDEENISNLIQKLKEKPEFNIRKSNKEYLTNVQSQEYLLKNGSEIIIGANLHDNEYGHPLFADYFFF